MLAPPAQGSAEDLERERVVRNGASSMGGLVVTRARIAEQRRIASQVRDARATGDSPRPLELSGKCVTVHVHQIVTAMAVGILEADPWHQGYTVAPKLESVVNHVSRCVQVRMRDCDVVRMTLGEIERLLRAWTEEHAIMRGWNRLGNPAQTEYVSREAGVSRRREFIDLDAVYRNAILYLARQCDADLSEHDAGDVRLTDAAGPLPSSRR